VPSATSKRGGRRPGAGRKPSGEPTRIETVTVYLTPDELAAIEAASATAGEARGEYLRQAGLARAKQS
jgi:hypothetical protein